MTLPWCPLPRALLTSPRARMLSLDAVGALLVAWSLSDDTGTVRPEADTSARDGLAFVVEQHLRQSYEADTLDPREHAGDVVRELIAGGLLIVDGDALRLSGWVALDGAPPPRPPAPSPAVEDRAPDGPRAPGRPRLAAPMSPAERQERRRFDRRERGFRNVPAGVTWEQWRAENPVTKTPAAGHENSGRGHENSGHENSPSPRASGSGERKETRNIGEGAFGTRPSGHEKSGHENSPGHENHGASFRDQPRCSTVESALPFEADVVLDDMRKASAGRFASAAVSTQMQAFATLARELIARGHATVPALVKAAGHAPHVPWITRLPGPLTVQRLCADEGRVLVELISGSNTCKACGGDPLASGVIEIPVQRDRNGRPIAQPVMARDYLARRGVTLPTAPPADAPEVTRAR